MVKIKNWSKFQSYKDRRPPWIRFHRAILDDYQFQSMSADSRALLPMLWLLACEDEDPTSGLIRHGTQVISFRLRQPEKLIDKCIDELQDADFIERIESVTKPLQNRNEIVTPETETETETEKRQRRDRDIFDIFDYWKNVMQKGSQAKLTAKRKTKVSARLDDGYEVETILLAIDGCARSPYHMGKNDTGTVYDDLELICREGDKLEQFAHNVGKVIPENKNFDIGGFLNDKLTEATNGSQMGSGIVHKIESNLS